MYITGRQRLRTLGLIGVLVILGVLLPPAGGTVESQSSYMEFPGLTGSAQFVTTGPDGNVWFTEQSANRIGRISPAGTVTEFVVPTASSTPQFITTGPDGALWFTELSANKIGRITTSGAITEFVVP